ncbi:MAG: hypothetical protein J5737_07860 [Bacteroidales bacterium]|nr:hypothetical protein [Bacteroidales bacterium]
MTKKYYSAPQAEWLEAVNAGCFLQESLGGTIPSLEEDDTYSTINW